MSVKTALVAPAIAASPIADPAPLGLAAFALTTFLLSAANAHWMNGNATGDAWLGYAFAYGGLAQLLAGMWEFRNRNVFGATAFSTYGGFWIGLGLWFLLVAGRARPAVAAGTAFLNHDLGWILLAFAIFNTYMLLFSAQVNAAVFGVFLTLEAHRDHPGHRVLLQQCWHRPVRRLRGPRHGARRLVHLRGRRLQRPGRPDQAPRRQAAAGLTGPLRLPVGKPLISGS